MIGSHNPALFAANLTARVLFLEHVLIIINGNTVGTLKISARVTRIFTFIGAIKLGRSLRYEGITTALTFFRFEVALRIFRSMSSLLFLCWVARNVHKSVGIVPIFTDRILTVDWTVEVENLTRFA